MKTTAPRFTGVPRQGQKTRSSNDRVVNHNRPNFKGKTFAVRDQRDNWYFTQAGVKLLKVHQQREGVVVTLLRFTTSINPFSTVASWSLPFKLNNIRAFLMYPYLQDEEKRDENLMSFLSSFATQQKKFEVLMTHRINSIIKALSDDSTKYPTQISNINTDHDWAERLCDEWSVKYKPNFFIEDLLKKNNIKIKY